VLLHTSYAHTLQQLLGMRTGSCLRMTLDWSSPAQCWHRGAAQCLRTYGAAQGNTTLTTALLPLCMSQAAAVQAANIGWACLYHSGH
jgi:hypothetical protein